MPPEIAALIDKPPLLMAVVAVGTILGMGIAQFSSKLQRRAWRKRNPYSRNKIRFEPRYQIKKNSAGSELLSNNQSDAADQLRIVMGAGFSIQPLLNQSERRVFKELTRAVLEYDPRWQVMAQVSLGEILSSEDAAAYRCINAKRVDLLLVDENYIPRHVIEYQGRGHFQGTAAARDAVKKEALRRAGIGYHEVVAGFTRPSELRQLVEKLIVEIEVNGNR